MLGQTSKLLAAVPGVSHRFFGRIGGTSPSPFARLNTSYTVGDAPARVDENLARVRFQLGVGRRSLFSATQVHGARCLVVEEEAGKDQVAEEEADALLTLVDGVAVSVRTADCVPVLFAARDGRAVAAAHAGWRGAVGGILSSTIAAFSAQGVEPRELVAAVGPCISRARFEVGPEVIDAAACAIDLDGLVDEGAGDRSFLDLAGLCARLLEREGVEAETIGGCTFDDDERYFSHRRDRGRTGRQLSAIARCEPPDLDPDQYG